MNLEEFDRRAAKLSPDKMEMESELELSMYRITEWKLGYYNGKYIYIYISNENLLYFLSESEPDQGLIFRKYIHKNIVWL